MHVGSFEPVVMFFGLTNSPAIFQTMINDIFRDLINKGDVTTFIDNVLIGTEMEEGHCQALVLGELGRGLAATLGCAYHCTSPKGGEGNRSLVVGEVSRTTV